ncbi:hypothetical protein SO802_012021 [Lithocarpus litseifolius]|uniref:Uncharacterized protein n=1 Tax=Lithocarpus litseifolius TaxID=425828 RepID=A0AAW2D542_9ROSI
MITTSLYDGPIYFDVYPDICLALDDPNIIKALNLNVLTSDYDMDEEDPVSQNHLNVIKKSTFVKEDKTVVRSSQSPLETVLVTTCQKTEIKTSPFKIADADTPVSGIIEQCNFANKSLHIIGQQLDRIEEKIVEQTVSTKPKKPLIDLPSQREKITFKTSQSKTLDIIEKMLSDLNVKTEGTSSNVAAVISRNGKEAVFEENTDSESSSSVDTKNVFKDSFIKIDSCCSETINVLTKAVEKTDKKKSKALTVNDL